MQTLERPDGTLVYEVVGEGTPLFLVSGLGGSRSYWNNLLPDLTPHFTVVLHDHMGTGQTDSRRAVHTVQALADDVTALMDHLGIETSSFLGHSTGAAIGQIIAADSPGRIDKLLLFAGWAGPDPHVSLCFEARKALLLSAGLRAYHRSSPLFLYPPLWISENYEALETLMAGMIAASPPPDILTKRMDMVLAFDRRSQMQDIKTSTLVICAEDDLLTPLYLSEELVRGIPGAKLALLPWGGHAASQTNPEEFLKIVLTHLHRSIG